MNLFHRTVFACSILLASSHSFAGEEPSLNIEVFDQRFHDVIKPGARIELLADGLQWSEGPVWVDRLNALLFSDLATNRVYRWNESAGLRVFLTPSGHNPDDGPSAWRGSNGLAIDGNGRLILAQQSSRRVARMTAALDDPRANYEVLVSSFEGKSLNSPNDLIVHDSGDIYFTDPPYGLDGFEKSPAIELDFFGVFRLPENGKAELIFKDLDKPNGLALSPDQSRLYVSNSGALEAKILALDLDDDGRLKSSSLFYDFSDWITKGPGSTDGMTMHPDGYLFVSIPNGFAILTATAELLGTVNLGQVTNLAIGGSPRYLYITTPERLLRLKL